MIFEHKSLPLMPFNLFLKRLLRFAFYSSVIIVFSLLSGVLGYHFIEKLSLIDSFLNASMILTGMGPADKMNSEGGKIFAAFYALYSGVAFLSTIAIMFTPVAHRVLHILHLDEKEWE